MVRTEQQTRGTKWLKGRCCGPEGTFEGSFEAAALMLMLMPLVALMTTDSERSDGSCVPTTTPPSPTHLHSHTITHTLWPLFYYFVKGSPTLAVWFWRISEKLQPEAATQPAGLIDFQNKGSRAPVVCFHHFPSFSELRFSQKDKWFSNTRFDLIRFVVTTIKLYSVTSTTQR